jgi:hypothetical protein
MGLPKDAAEAITQKNYAEIAKAQSKAMQDRIKQIQGDKNLQPAEKTSQIQAVMAEGNLTSTPQGTSSQPLGYPRTYYSLFPERLRNPVGTTNTQNPPLSVPPIVPPRDAPIQSTPGQDNNGATPFNVPGGGGLSPTSYMQPAAQYAYAPISSPEDTYNQQLQGGYVPQAAPIG